MGLAVDGANRHDMKLGRATVDSLPVPRPAPSPDQPQGMCLDKGYDFDEVRRTLDEFGFTAHIRSRGEEAKAIKREAGFKARRWVVERSHSWLNRFRRILVRWDKVSRQLHRLPSLRLRPHRPQSCWIIRIGSKADSLSRACPELDSGLRPVQNLIGPLEPSRCPRGTPASRGTPKTGLCASSGAALDVDEWLCDTTRGWIGTGLGHGGAAAGRGGPLALQVFLSYSDRRYPPTDANADETGGISNKQIDEHLS